MRSRVRQIVSIFFNGERTDRILRAYIHHRNLYAKGAAEMSFFKTVVEIQGVMVGWLFIKSIMPNIPTVLLAVGAVVLLASKVALCWAIGLWWDSNRHFDKEADWSNKRNPTIDLLGKKLDGGKDE